MLVHLVCILKKPQCLGDGGFIVANRKIGRKTFN